MIVKDLLIKMDNIVDDYLKMYPLFADYELEAMTKEEIEKYYKKIGEKFKLFLLDIKERNTSPTDGILFVVKHIDEYYDNKGTSISSFVCYKSDINKKIKNEITLWNNDDENRIEHYAYDFESRNNVLSFELFIDENVSELEAACEIINEMILLGIDEEDNNKEKDKIIKSLEESIDNIENGEKTYSLEEVFEKLEKNILENSNDEQKESFKKHKLEKEKNKDRDDLYYRIASRINHKTCISAIEKYFLNNS